MIVFRNFNDAVSLLSLTYSLDQSMALLLPSTFSISRNELFLVK
jgi:hypothetical protein